MIDKLNYRGHDFNKYLKFKLFLKNSKNLLIAR